jgi:uncharacterized repeat protein (TIGR01451 family)
VGYAYSNDGIKAQTSNGLNWEYMPFQSSQTKPILDIDFPTPLVGYMAVGSESIRKTTNGGNTWFNHGNGFDFSEIHFSSEQIGFAKRVANQATGATTQYYQTSDGGTSWNQTSSGISNENYKFAPRTGAELWGIKSILFGQNNKIYKSINAGNSWTDITIPGTERLSQIFFLNAQLGWAADDSGKVARTTNGGQNWEVSNWNGRFASKLSFTSSTHGWILGSGGFRLYFTTDGGASWNSSNSFFNSKVTDFHFTGNINGWLVGSFGLLAQTTDGGQTFSFQQKNTVPNFTSVTVQNKNRAWAIGPDLKPWISNDNGKNWVKSLLTNFNFQKIQFPIPSVGYASIGSKLLKTQTGGANWTEILSPPGFGGINDFFFVNKERGWVITSNGSLRTLNGGATWETFNDNTSSQLIHFINFQNGFKITSTNFCYSTNNAGVTWNLRGNAGTYPSTMFFVDNQYGWVGGYDGKISRTTNGGQTWQQVDLIPNQLVSRIRFSSRLQGYASTLGGIYESSDGGITWNKSNGNFSSEITIRDFDFYNNKPAIAVGDYGSLFTTNDWKDSPRNVITGKIVGNENNDCVQNPNELPLPYRIVYTEPGFNFGITDPNGKFVVKTDSGTFNLTQIQSSNSFFDIQYCPVGNQGIPVSTGPINDTLKNNNFINEVTNCPILKLDVFQSFLRPCRASYLYINIQNQGNLASDSEWVHVNLPSELVYLRASYPGIYNPSDLTYRFKIGPIAPYQQFSFWIEDSVVCNTNLTGSTICARVEIPNVLSCLLPSPGWDGSNLEVASRCQNNQTRFTLRNAGASMAATSQYQIFIDSALVYQAPFQLSANNSMTVTLPANAPPGFVRLVVPQSANHPLSTFASAQANCATGQSTNGMFPPSDQSPLVDIECVTITNSYDPNDKLVYPKGWGTAGNVEPETEFKYTIRFQNTGTDTAFKVVLVDTLDTNLDIASLQIGVASHPFEFQVSGKGRPVLTWTFDNILLPDSGRNQEASNGFVSFSIRPKTGLALGTRLENYADIYFDFNDPIRTNTTVNTLWRPTLVAGVLDTVFVTDTRKILSHKSLKMSPNPATDFVMIELPDGSTSNLEISDLQGKRIKNLEIVSGQKTSIKDLKPGIYILKVEGFKAERLVVKP